MSEAIDQDEAETARLREVPRSRLPDESNPAIPDLDSDELTLAGERDRELGFLGCAAVKDRVRHELGHEQLDDRVRGGGEVEELDQPPGVARPIWPDA